MLGLEKRYEIARLIACELIGVLSGREVEDLEVWKNSSEKHGVYGNPGKIASGY